MPACPASLMADFFEAELEDGSTGSGTFELTRVVAP